MSGKEFSPTGIDRKGLVPSFAMDRVLGWASPEIDVRGSGNLIEARGLMESGVPHLVVANHLSNADGPVIKSIFGSYNFPDPVFVRGTRLNEQWFTRFMAGGVDGISVWPESVVPKDEHENMVRSEMNRNAVAAAREVLNQGKPLVVFPEGTRSRDGSMRRVSHKNARYLLLNERTRILPIGLWNTELVFPIDKKFPRRGHNAQFSAGRSISVDQLAVGLELESAEGQGELMNRVMSLVAGLIPEKYQGVYALENKQTQHHEKA